MTIQHYLVPNPLKPEMLRSVLLPGDRASFDAFLDHCEVVSTVGRANALAVVEADWGSPTRIPGDRRLTGTSR